MKEREINLMKRMDRYLGIPLLYLMKPFLFLFSPSPSSEPVAVKKIVMMKLWGIGNLVMIIPLVRAVREAYPHAEIHFVTLKGNEALLGNVSQIDHLITFHPRGIFRTLFRLLQVARRLRRIQPDLVLDFEQFLRITPILAGLSGSLQTIGFQTTGQSRIPLFNVKVPYRKDRHMSLAFGDIVRSAGIRTHGLPPLAVPRSLTALQEVQSFLETLPDGKGPLVALHLGSGDNFPGRRWPVKSFAVLAEKLVKEKGARCIITGTASERWLGTELEELTSIPLINTMGRFHIMAFIELLALMDLLVTNDTAPAHIGSALGIPLIAFYGPNTPDLYGPLHEMSRVFYHPLPCSPCLTNLNAKTSSCRIPSCIMNIDPHHVFEAAKDLLAVRKERKTDISSGEAS